MDEVTDVDGAEEAITPYQQLSETRKQEFEASLESESVELDKTTETWVSTTYVEYCGDCYYAAVAVLDSRYESIS